MTQKYELIDVSDSFYRIRALIDIPRHGVKAGDLGGRVQTDYNLSQKGDCWIEYDAVAFARSCIRDNAILKDTSQICDRSNVSGDAILLNASLVLHYGSVRENAIIDAAFVTDHSDVFGNSRVKCVCLQGTSLIEGNTELSVAGSWPARVVNLQGEFTPKDYLFQGPALSSARYSFAHRDKDGNVTVRTGCFVGSLDEYLAAIEETHKDEPTYLKQYRRFHQNFVNHFSQ